ncbi:MAG TPA: glycosyltransferase, partial [Sphingobacteriaceae bacterium]
MLSSKFNPYAILNVSITDIASFDPPKGNNYVVFWYQKIPLGHLWLNKILSLEEFKEQAIQAIAPALGHYTGNKITDAQEWLSLIEKDDITGWFDEGSFDLVTDASERISVVICTRNRPGALKECIEQLFKSDDRNFELIVVDNASDDNQTREVLESYPEVKYVREDRKGLDIARNTGIANANGGIIAFTDDDVLVDRTWISELKRSFNNPQTMAVTGLIIPSQIQSEAQYIFERFWSFNKGYLSKTFDYHYFQLHLNEGVPVWDIGAGANMAFRKEIFWVTGDFDERLDVGAAGCSGDSEIWYRILAEGWNCYYNPRIVVYHQHRKSMKELRHQLFNYMRGHVSALLVQYENYKHEGNLKRLRKSLPIWYAQRIKKYLKTLDHVHVQTLTDEVLGYFSGRRFYSQNSCKKEKKTFALPESLLKPAVVYPDSKISVIIPCYNYGRYLGEAISSVKRQTHAFYEIIVVDDGSEDNTEEVCRSFPGVRYVKIPHSGVSIARNIGAAYSTGDYLVFLDADDILYPNALEINLYFFKFYPEVTLVCGAYDLINDKSEMMPNSAVPQQHKDDFYEALLSGNFIGMQSNVMYRRQLFPYFNFDSQLKSSEDYDLNLRISYDLPAFAHPQKIAAYRRHQHNASSESAKIHSAAIRVLSNQKSKLRTEYERKAFQEGLINWDKHYSVDNKNIRTPQEPPLILPLKSSEKRPRWSVMVPTYNCYPYIRECLESVLAQNIPADEIQIEVIDDCSTDGDVERLVKETGNGSIQFFRQEKNVGSLRNFETCINRARGEYIHILHGDDKIKAGFYDEIGCLFEQNKDIGAAFTDFEYIDSSGNKLYTEAPLMEATGLIDNWLEKIAVRQRVQPPAMVIKRSVYEHLGGYCAVHYGEDWEMYVRIAASYPVAHCIKQLAQYRVHGTNITSQSLLSGQNVRDIEKVISLIQKYVPQEKRKLFTTSARRHFSIYFASVSDKIYHEYGNPQAAMKQAYRAL